MNKVLAIKRPIDYDENLKPSTDVNSERYGFPSIESYMSIIIIGHWWLQTLSLFYFILGAALCFIIGSTRVLAKSRFPHQIVGSWLLGIGGLVVGFYIADILGLQRCERLIKIHLILLHRMTRSEHVFVVVGCLICYLCYFAFNMESNDCRILYTNKSEFKKVLVHILESSNQRSYDDLNYNLSNTSAPLQPGNLVRQRSEIVQTPRSVKVSELLSRKTRGYVKHDSFYFLQRSLEQREGIRQELDNDYVSKTRAYEKNL